jgi:hypothetical protein
MDAKFDDWNYKQVIGKRSVGAFETSLQDARTTEYGEMIPISLDNINKTLEA